MLPQLLETRVYMGISAGSMVTGYALDDESAIKVVDGSVEVVSGGKWVRYN